MCYILCDKMNIHFTIQQQKKGLNFMNSLVVKFLISFYEFIIYLFVFLKNYFF